ncbi:hypothetical protein SE17_17290 [Kouleothrix aurantiaca]|jgi:uncharacterized protein (DUF58 family)|uniref:DUF58 domain-containing protein n=1 Tax=Kouleothrix aurantiaca TaxID=186479 RepID=A0A0P9D9F4_9CHLR|nr:hypothetical protein SE17_17290 [Kouleothrix aurantiaca]
MTVAPAPLFDPTFLRKLDRLALLTRRAMAGDMQGERRSPRRGSSVEFADFRPYARGDDIRQIDWNLYARMERFFLKLMVAEEELTIHLLLDNTASMDWGEPNKLLYARRVAAAFGYIALSSLDRVTVTALAAGKGQQLPSVRGKRGALPLFDFIQKLPGGAGGNLQATAKRYVQTARNVGPLLLCSDLMDPEWKEALRTLTARPFEITVVHTLAPQELRPDIDGDFRLLDAEGGPALEITADLEVLRQYDEHLREWRAEIESFCSGRGINYIFADTAVPVEDFVLGNLRRRGALR